MSNFNFSIPIFGQLVHVYQVSNIANQANSIIRDNNYNLELVPEGSYDGYTLSNDLSIIHIIFNHSVKPSTIVHETIHAASMMLEGLSVKLSIENEELLCYLSEYIFNQITEKIK